MYDFFHPLCVVNHMMDAVQQDTPTVQLTIYCMGLASHVFKCSSKTTSKDKVNTFINQIVGKQMWTLDSCPPPLILNFFSVENLAV